MALNNKPGISETTRQLVLKTAEQLGYQQKPRQKEARSIALINLTSSATHELSAPFFSNMISGVSKRAQEMEYSLLITTIPKQKDCFSAVNQYLKDNSCVGAIMLISEADQVQDFSEFNRLTFPVVLLDTSSLDYPVDTVTVNHFQGAYAATKYVMSQGHKKLCFFCGNLPHASAYRERLLGYQYAVGLDPLTAACAYSYFSASTDFNELARKIIQLPELPTAFVCAGDWYALECIQALSSLGYRIPQDVSVIGFDNSSICELSSPKITSMNSPLFQMGCLAVERLISVLEKKHQENIRIELYTSLVIRDSVGPVRTQP